MRVLFDEGVPKALAGTLSRHEISTVPDEGWAAIIRATVCHSDPFDNHWPAMKPYTPAICDAVDAAKRGTAIDVFCGTFIPARFRQRST